MKPSYCAPFKAFATLAVVVRFAWAALLSSFFWTSTSAAQTVIDIATGYPDSSFHVQNLRQFAQEVTEASRGELRVEVHAAGSKLKAPEILQGVISGRVAAGEVFGPSLSGIHGVFGLDAIPFLATDYVKARKMWKTVERTVEAELAKKGLTLLMSVPWPPQGLFSTRPIATPKDAVGLIMRENSPPVKRLAELIQATPLRVETPDLANAAKERRIEMVFTSAAQGIDTRLYEPMPYFYRANAWLPRNVVMINSASFAKLTKAQQLSLTKLAGRAEERGWLMSEKFAQTSTEALAKAGAKVQPLSLQVQSRLERAGNQIAREALKAGDPALLSMMMELLN